MNGQSLIRVGAYLRNLLKFIGPGFMVAVGYLDPGNWSVDMEAGSSFGYKLLFIIFVSNIIAIFLQNLAIRLGTVTGMDLAACSKRYLPRYLNLFLYCLAEMAIIATDLAEVIGSAIAINLLFPTVSLPAGVAITAADVLIILLFYNEDDEKNSKKNEGNDTHYFEWFVMLLVSAVGVCFLIELILSPVDVPQVFIGYLPSSSIFTDPDCLYVAIGIIGATVMPHNLFLHSFIVQSRCYSWRSERPTTLHHDINLSAQINNNDNEEGSIDIQQQQKINKNQSNNDNDDKISLYNNNSNNNEYDEYDDDDDDDEHKALVNKSEKKDHNAIFIEDNDQYDDNDGQQRNNDSIIIQSDKSFKNMDSLRNYLSHHINTNLHYSFIDLIVALCFAFFINSAILIVASSNFHQENSTTNEMSDLFDAHALLKQYIGPSAALVFAIALLCAGQSSTLTATLAGQVVMSGFLGMTTRPWLRRLLTRFIAIIPAMTAACFAGRSGLSQMLLASQVALSIQLPFAVVPLLYFTSNPTIMKLDLIQPFSPNDNDEENNSIDERKKQFSALSLLWSRLSSFCSYYYCYLLKRNQPSNDQHQSLLNDEDATCMNDLSSSSSTLVSSEQKDIIVLPHWPAPLTYSNSLLVNIFSVLIAILLICLNVYLVITTLF